MMVVGVVDNGERKSGVLFSVLLSVWYLLFFFLLGECESGAGKKISCHTVVRKCLLLLAQS